MRQRRILNYGTFTNRNLLQQNPKHIFASNHALRIFRSNAIYSFIPKNACSTMRLSIAIENGCINSGEDINWIHGNNTTFKADLASLIAADYTFVILRCPFARLASCFLDKVVGKTTEAWDLYDQIERSTEIDDMSFRSFTELVCNPRNLRHNIHWRPQVDFLVFKDYDDYFALEDFDVGVNRLKGIIGLEIVDARGLTRNGIDRLRMLPENQDFSNATVREIAELKFNGTCPHPRSLYTDALISLVSAAYQEDIDLYLRRIGSGLLFP